jgi:DNA-binding CsgD family transcriptional regulator
MPWPTAVEFAIAQTEVVPTVDTAEPAAASLTPREREVITLVATGKTDSEIAAELAISTGTVRSNLDRIRHKTGARRRAGITRLALEAGLV